MTIRSDSWYFDVNRIIWRAECFIIMKFRNCKFNITQKQKKLSGLPYAWKISVIFWCSSSNLHFIITVQLVKDLIRSIFLDLGAKGSQIRYNSIKIDFCMRRWRKTWMFSWLKRLRKATYFIFSFHYKLHGSVVIVQMLKKYDGLVLRSKGTINITKVTEWFGNLIIFTNPSAWAGYDTRSVFKRSLTGLNSEFSFS